MSDAPRSVRPGARAAAPRRRRRRKPSTATVAASAPRADRVRRRLARWLGGAAVAVLMAASAALFIVYPAQRPSGAGHAVDVVVPPRPSPEQLGAILAAAGLVSSPRLFAWWVRATGGATAVAAGRHLLTDDASPGQLMARLERRGAATTARVTFPEGWNRFDMARRLEDKRVVDLRSFLDATVDAPLLHELGIDGDSAEGFLFPSTYDLPLDGDARDVVRRMKREFDRRWDLLSNAHPTGLADVMASAGLDVRGVVTLASMVEKEAAVDDERPIIASVFLNRLRDPAFRPKRLECDPTATYGCLVAPERSSACAAFSGKATASIEHDPDNAYSTYTHEGLPPGPIANPGAKSLEAVMAPSTSPYFFFVARGEGRHAFSEHYDAHLSAIRGAGADAGARMSVTAK